jgi:hypothetical protein
MLQRLSNVLQRACIAGFLAGLLLIALDAVLPERAGRAVLYTGVALVLVSVAAILPPVEGGTRLRRWGMSPVIGVILGVIAGALPALLGDHSLFADAGRQIPATATASPAARTRPPMQVAQPRDAARSSDSRMSSTRLESALAEAAEALRQRARPVLESQGRFLDTVLRDGTIVRDPESVRSQLESNARDLAAVESALARIRSDNQDLDTRLDEILGDTTTLGALNSSLRELSGINIGAKTNRARMWQLANQTTVASQWADSADRRVADARSESRPVSR